MWRKKKRGKPSKKSGEMCGGNTRLILFGFREKVLSLVLGGLNLNLNFNLTELVAWELPPPIWD